MHREKLKAAKKVLFFDINNTLIDQKLTMKQHFIATIQEFTGRWDASEADWTPETLWQEYARAWSRIQRGKNKQPPTRGGQQLKALQSVLRNYPFDTSESFAQAFFKIYNNKQQQRPQLFEQARPVLEQLSKRYKLAVITNGNTLPMSRLQLNGLIPEHHVFTAQKTGQRKPHPSIFLHALQTMGISSTDALMIGNSWKADIEGATRSGMDAIWINRLQPRAISWRKINGRRVAVVRSIGELQTLLI